MARLWVSALQLAFLCLLVCPPSLLAQSQGRFGLQIDVQVRYADGRQAPRGLHIVLESAEGGAAGDCQTADGGRCEFRPSSTGVYVVKMNELGYKEVSARVELISITRQFVTLNLQPLDGSSPTQTQSQALGGAVSAAELNMPPKARLEFEKAQKSIEGNKLDDGITHLRKSISLYDASPRVHLTLGSAYLEQKNWKDAEASFEKAIQLDPKLADAYLQLGAVFNQTKDYPKAETALAHGLLLDPDAAGGHYELAKTYWAMGRWQDAAPHATTAVNAFPSLAAPHVLLGNILLRKNDSQGALHEYQEYLRLDPNGPMAPGTREIIGKIQKALVKK
jgi:tetratricopeptide (TPR) repeat protein